MNIVIGSSAPPDLGSGIGNYAKELSEALFSIGHTIHYLSPPPQDYTWIQQNGFHHISTDQFDDPIQRCCELIEYFKANDLHGAINNDNPFLQCIAPALNCPIISVGHMDRKSVAALACFGWQWIDYVVSISMDMYQVFTNIYNVPKDKCPIIFNGVKDRLKIDIEYNFSSPLNVIYSGGHSINKGGDKVLSLIEKYQNLSDRIELHWFGDCKPKIRKKLFNYSNVNYYGRVLRDKFIEQLSKSDIILIPSKYEGCPMVLLEAFSFGVVPISSYGHGAMKNIIDNDNTGYIYHLSDWTSQTFEILIQLFNNRHKLLTMKKSVRDHYKKLFDIKVVANSLLNLLSNPTVSRDSHPKSIPVLKWHRPLRPDGLKAPLIDRFCINFGFLRKAGHIKLFGR